MCSVLRPACCNLSAGNAAQQTSLQVPHVWCLLLETIKSSQLKLVAGMMTRISALHMYRQRMRLSSGALGSQQAAHQARPRRMPRGSLPVLAHRCKAPLQPAWPLKGRVLLQQASLMFVRRQQHL